MKNDNSLRKIRGTYRYQSDASRDVMQEEIKIKSTHFIRTHAPLPTSYGIIRTTGKIFLNKDSVLMIPDRIYFRLRKGVAIKSRKDYKKAFKKINCSCDNLKTILIKEKADERQTNQTIEHCKQGIYFINNDTLTIDYGYKYQLIRSNDKVDWFY